MSKFRLMFHFIDGTKVSVMLEAGSEEEIMNRVVAREWFQYTDAANQIFLIQMKNVLHVNIQKL